MASYSKRKEECKKPHKISYYNYDKMGKKKPTSKSFKTQKEAMKFLAKVSQLEEKGPIAFSKENATFSDLLDDYLKVEASQRWKSTGTQLKNYGRLNNYILPVMSDVKLKDITTSYIEHFYLELQNKKSVKTNENINSSIIESIHKLLNSIFNYAIKHDYIIKNPCFKATRPKYKPKKKVVWEEEDLINALEIIDKTCDRQTNLLINMAFAGTLRASELSGLKMSDIKFDKTNDRAKIFVEREFVRVNKKYYDQLSPEAKKKYIKKYPSPKNNKTFMAEASLKNKSSERHFWLPKTLAKLLMEEIEYVNSIKDNFDDAYKNSGFIFVNYKTGRPLDKDGLRDKFNDAQMSQQLDSITFHAIRHMSIQEKLKISKGDIKSVQGDSGHATSEMVTDEYSKIQEKDRIKLAKKFEEKFYIDENDYDSKVVRKLAGSYEICKQVISLIKSYPEIYEKVLILLQIKQQITC